MNAQTAFTSQAQHVVPRVAKADSRSSRNYPGLRASLGFVAFLLVSATTLAQTAPSLGTATNFAVLGGSGVTNTGPSVVTGDLGSSPTTTIIGFPPGLVSGTIHAGGAATGAQTDVTTAYNTLAGEAVTSNLTGQDLGGLTLTPGVYFFSSSAQLTGTLTLNGNSSDVWVFQIGSTLTTASASKVVLSGGASPCNVFWQVGSSATLGTGTEFIGNILALTSITLTTGASSSGSVLARNGAVTLDRNAVSVCGTSLPTKFTTTLSTQASAPTDGLIHDTATLGGGTSPIGGTIAFQLFGPNNTGCTGSPTFTSTVPVTSIGNYNSANFRPLTVGTYRWIATYSGDATNSASVTACNDPTESVDVTVIVPPPAATAIPTLTEWAMIMLAAFLAITGFAAIRRQPR